MSALEQLRPLADISVDVEARLECCSLTVEQLLALQEDSLLYSDRAAGDNVDIQVGGQLIGAGEIIVLGSSLGFRIADFREKF
jgi:flagellar motor switch/type III secretory pathway protein FliN